MHSKLVMSFQEEGPGEHSFSSQETDGEESEVESQTDTCEALPHPSKKVNVATHKVQCTEWLKSTWWHKFYFSRVQPKKKYKQKYHKAWESDPLFKAQCCYALTMIAM